MEDVKEEYFELLKFETVGAEPMHLRDCVQCAMWLKKWLEQLGFAAQLQTVDGAPPIVFATRGGSEGAPTILFYGHYDVQPPDPLNEWLTPPFVPTEREGRIYARGAQDDKGQFFAFLCGLRDFLANASTVPSIKIVLEGQEESGSVALAKLLESAEKPDLAADVMLVCDTSAAAELRPAIVAGLRGVSHFTLRLEGPSHDLHSGEFGGIAPNPAQGMARLIASLHNADGSIAVEGFCDGIIAPTDAERTAAESAAMSDDEFASVIGCEPCGGERGLTPTERNSFRPTIEVNGIHSGYGGPSSKTVIPSSALAKISMRLVPGQNPRDVMAALTRHLKRNTPRGLKLFIEDLTGEAAGFRLPLASPLFQIASDVLSRLDPRGPVFQWDGASIPIVSALHAASSAAPLLVGFGQAADRIHSPNESFSPAQFTLCRSWAKSILEELCR